MKTGLPVATAPVVVPASRQERLIVPAAFITSLGNSVQLTASAVLLVQTARTTLSVGWLFIAVAIPQVLLSLYFGSLADRFDRRRLSVLCDLLSALAAITLPIWLLLGGSSRTGAYAVSFLLAALAALFTPASSALIKERVPDARLGHFNANYEIATQAGTLLSAAAGGFMIQYFGVRPLFFFNALTFLASAALLYATGRRPAAAPHEPAVGGQPATGAPGIDGPATHPATTHPPTTHPATTGRSPTSPQVEGARPGADAIGRLALLYAFGNIVITLSNALLVVLVLETFRRGAGMLGLVDAVAGIGIMFAAVAYKRISLRTPNLRITLLGYLGCCLIIALEPFNIFLLMALIPFSGMFFGMARVAARTMLMTAVHESRTGRVFGATQALGLGLGAVFTILLALVADHTSIRNAFFGLALVVGVGTTATVVSLRRSSVGWAR